MQLKRTVFTYSVSSRCRYPVIGLCHSNRLKLSTYGPYWRIHAENGCFSIGFDIHANRPRVEMHRLEIAASPTHFIHAPCPTAAEVKTRVVPTNYAET